MELSSEVKSQLIADIEKGDESALRGMMETLKICLGDSGNPNVLSIEFTLSQLEYLDAWSANTGLDRTTIIRGLVDIMMKNKPELGTIRQKAKV